MGKTTDTTARKGRVTIKDVASAADVSIATVSYVLNNKPGQSISEETRKKVFQFANLLGYECNVMARYLATGKTNTVAVVVKNVEGIGSAYYIKLITELTRLFAEHNRALRVCDYTAELERTGAPCDAYITLGLSEQDFRMFADTKYVPVVAIDTVFEDLLFYRINDDFAAMYQAAKKELPDCEEITLLTHPLPEECLAGAEKVFDGVTVIRSLRDLPTELSGTGYATQSRFIADFLHCPVFCAKNSFELKASAAVEAVNKAIGRVDSSAAEHNIEI
ncbi:MAG: LacI family transcriptional regulator [Clostridiales bacterium]|nr:LacI family transcriptional regulator [Clostridiales bacterium]